MEKTIKIYYITPYLDDDYQIEREIWGAFQTLMRLMDHLKFEMSGISTISGKGLTTDVYKHIIEADIVICNLAKNNPNSMYELGLAHALNKPTIILIDNESSILFDLNSIRYITYDPKSLPGHIEHQLAKVLTLMVEEPENWKLNLTGPKLNTKEDNRKSIFISYSHKDTAYLERIKIHLRPLERKGIVQLWSDTLILSGEKWKEKIEAALDKAAIALLLISADFLASEFIINNEMQPLLKSAENKGTIIIPVVIKPCRFLRESSISQFQSANDPINPLCKLSEYEQEDIYEKVANRIELAIGSE